MGDYRYGICKSCSGDNPYFSLENCEGCKKEVCCMCGEIIDDKAYCFDCAQGLHHAKRTEEESQASQAK